MSNIELDTDLLELLPPWYREIVDYQAICTSEKEQFEILAAFIHVVADNFLFQRMTASMIEQWERVFGIVPAPAVETLEFRRARVLNRVSTRPPFTLGFLYQRLDELIGVGAWNVEIDYPNHTLYIESSARDQAYASEVTYTVNLIKPAHIVYINRPYLSNTLLLSETIEQRDRVFNYRMGAWGLGINPFAHEESKGVIKLATTPSVTHQLLGATADFVAGDITKARVNGATIISGLTKIVNESTVTISYGIPLQAQPVTLVELLDSADRVLTASVIYLTVEAQTILKHTIPIKEGAASTLTG